MDCGECFNKVTHVIFDLDGTLLDTETIIEKIFDDLVGKSGKCIPANVKVRILGSPTTNAARVLIDELQLPMSIEEFSDEYKKLSQQRLPKLKLMTGAERLIKHFDQYKVPMAIGTSSDSELAHVKFSTKPDLFNLMHHIVTFSDVLNGKPSPDIFLLACKNFPDRPRPESCLVFEDSPNGVKAANTAKMQCVMTPDPRLHAEQCQEATLVIKSLLDFQPELFGLPPF